MTAFWTPSVAITPPLAEIRSGHKRSHWMWYIFPQIAGLGQSSTARYYSIRDLEEAREYYAHPVLGQRLREISGVLLELRGSDPVAVFGDIDSMKLKSSMTLFAVAAPDDHDCSGPDDGLQRAPPVHV